MAGEGQFVVSGEFDMSFRRTNTFQVRTDTGEETVIEEHTHFQGETPGMKQYRTRSGASATRLSENAFEIAGMKGPIKATVVPEVADET